MLVNSAGEREFKVQLDRNGEISDEAVSVTILDHVWETHDPVIIYDALTDPLLSNSASVHALGLRSIMCAPLISRGEIIGAIYLENRSVASVFQQRELEPLTFFANQAAVSIENALINQELEERVKQRTADLEYAVQQLERGWLDAVEANRIRTMILANVAHDIRSPIGLSISALQTIREGSFGAMNAKQNLWMDRVIDSLNHAITLTSDIFDLSKAELSQLQLKKEMVDMRRFMVHLTQLGDGIEWAENVTFEYQLPKEMPMMEIDPTRMQQVIFNLLSNAHKFTKQGSVVLYAEVHPHKVIIGVRDTGAGIPEAQRDKVFERFHQAEQSDDTRFRGTGLGLAICKELVNLHGGDIWVESEVGKYSDFKIMLPL
jgi:signal transduction histidine kinase